MGQSVIMAIPRRTFLILMFIGGTLAQSCNPSIQWTRCPPSGRRCDACFLVNFNNAAGESDTMCLQNQGFCIHTGNLIGDGTYAVATSSTGSCQPFSNDPLEFSLSSSKCSGGFLLQNGQVKRPEPVFGPGVVDVALEIPQEPPRRRIP